MCSQSSSQKLATKLCAIVWLLSFTALESGCSSALMIRVKPCWVRLKDGHVLLDIKLANVNKGQYLEAIVDHGRLICRSAACSAKESSRRICLALKPGASDVHIPLFYQPLVSGLDSIQISTFAADPCQSQKTPALESSALLFRVH